ncbi:MAG: ribosome-binding factor A [Opitutales bacterium]|nr:ribosome-binding factor A [Opitutales bacterium]
MKRFRLIRINELLKRAISDYLRKYFRDEAASITITKVQTVDDSKRADVYFSVFRPEDRATAFQFLKKERNHIQFGISKEIRLKYTPQLFFVWDALLEKTHQMWNLLREIEIEQSSSTDSEADPS